ncbi:MAG: hypothetical protein JXA66_05560 [Oligoflexia bacterium]|nr:hypothetical protein [Oligoflexia bacterium]
MRGKAPSLKAKNRVEGLFRFFGFDTGNSFDFTSLGEKYLKKLRRTLITIQKASGYNKIKITLSDGKKLTVNNRAIAGFLKKYFIADNKFSAGGFAKICGYLEKYKTFAPVIDKNGVVVTAGCSEEDNPQMATMQWHSDSVWVADLWLRHFDKTACVRTIYTLAGIYTKQEETLESIISTPERHHRGKKLDGPAHIFNKDTLELDTSFNRRRLEAHGLAFGFFNKSIVSSFSTGKYTDFSATEIYNKKFADILKSISLLCRYFNAIEFYKDTTVTTGNWEEQPFCRSMWDTVSVTRAYESYYELMFNSYCNNSEIRIIREKITEYGGITDKKRIKDLIDKGRDAVSNYYPDENSARARDVSSVFTVAYGWLDTDQSIELLKLTEDALLSEHGIKRYKNDSYLAPNFWHQETMDKDGVLRIGSDTGKIFVSNDTGEMLEERQKLLKENFEAQWVLPIPVFVKAYSVIINKLHKQHSQTSDDGEKTRLKKLISELWLKENYFMAFTLSCLTPAGKYVTANGSPGQTCTFPEAYEAVTIITEDGRKKLRYIPGAHTSLAWSVANVFEAVKCFKKDLETFSDY